MKVDVKSTSHNLLRWAVQAIDVNARLASSLAAHSSSSPAVLTDSIYLLTHGCDVERLPQNTHLIFWDGINSYVELLARQPATANRGDLKFYVVGWLEGVGITSGVHIESLYPLSMTDQAKAWKRLSVFGATYHAPYWYRALTTLLTHTRYFKNAVADKQKHKLLVDGGKIVFCGLVTPTEHNVDAFFIGAKLPALQIACHGLTSLSYTANGPVIDAVFKLIFDAFETLDLSDASSIACVYSILNVMHRIKTLSLLHAKNANLFVNETRNASRFDPYDSFFYKNNLYLDFGSTRGPDALYPRTLDLNMTGKKYIPLRFLNAGQSVPDYINAISIDTFALTCEADAKAVLMTSR